MEPFPERSPAWCKTGYGQCLKTGESLKSVPRVTGGIRCFDPLLCGFSGRTGRIKLDGSVVVPQTKGPVSQMHQCITAPDVGPSQKISTGCLILHSDGLVEPVQCLMVADCSVMDFSHEADETETVCRSIPATGGQFEPFGDSLDGFAGLTCCEKVFSVLQAELGIMWVAFHECLCIAQTTVSVPEIVGMNVGQRHFGLGFCEDTETADFFELADPELPVAADAKHAGDGSGFFGNSSRVKVEEPRPEQDVTIVAKGVGVGLEQPVGFPTGCDGRDKASLHETETARKPEASGEIKDTRRVGRIIFEKRPRFADGQADRPAEIGTGSFLVVVL